MAFGEPLLIEMPLDDAQKLTRGKDASSYTPTHSKTKK